MTIRSASPVPSSLPLWKRLTRVWPFFKGFWLPWSLAVGGTVIAALTEPVVPALLKPLLDRGFQSTSVTPWLVPVALVALFAVRGCASFLSQYGLAKITNDGLVRFRQAMFDKLLNAKLSLFADQSSSTISNTIVYEVFNGSSLLINALLRLARDVMSLIALIGYLLYLNWRLVLVVALIFPAVTLVMRVLSKRLYMLTKQSQKATDDLAYVVEENVLAHRDIRLHAAQSSQAARFEVLSHSLHRLSMKSTIAYAGMSMLTQILSSIALAAVISVALFQGANNATTVGSFVAFVTAMLLLISPLRSLSDAATPITRGLAALERGVELMDLIQNESGGDFVLAQAKGDIEFKEVTVFYKADAMPAINRLSLSIKAGETVALVGSSGSGKTTLVNLLPRFVTLTKGSISLDGHDLTDWNLAALRSQFSMVSQYVVMLNTSIAVNVALGQAVNRDKVIDCLKAAHLGSLLNELPDGIDSVLGHNATQLSGGQRQRLAIARALYKDAPVLILDEATAALDTESEQAVQLAIRVLTLNRTSLIIAHRLSTILHADRIVMLSAGQAIESGTHAELLAQNGAYARLYRLGFQDVS